MRKDEKHQLLRFISDILANNSSLQHTTKALFEKVYLTPPSDDPFQELITGNLTEHEYIDFGKPKGFIWNPRIEMWMRHTGPCQNCGWQPGDKLEALFEVDLDAIHTKLQPRPPTQEVNPDGSLTLEALHAEWERWKNSEGEADDLADELEKWVERLFILLKEKKP